jgi:CspA family cold shock protein
MSFGGVFVASASLQPSCPKGGELTMSSRVTGKVEWFDGSKGFGYIHSDGVGKVFVHFSAITDNGIRHLRKGEEVEFSVRESPRGPEAVEVIRP